MSWDTNIVDWRKFIGKRVLVISREDLYTMGTDNPKEVEVVEVSPSGKYVKLDFGFGGEWVYVGKYVVVEVLD